MGMRDRDLLRGGWLPDQVGMRLVGGCFSLHVATEPGSF